MAPARNQFARRPTTSRASVPGGQARRYPDFVLAIAVLVLGFAGVVAWERVGPTLFGQVQAAVPAGPAPVAVTESFARCTGGNRQFATCVVDGDTLHYGGNTIRIADIDTPEISQPKCPAEKALGERATDRLIALLNAAPFAIEGYYRDADVYGRKLRILVRDGQSIGRTLVAEGLAREWGGGRRPWC